MGLVAVDTPFFPRGGVQLTTHGSGSPPWRREAYLTPASCCDGGLGHQRCALGQFPIQRCGANPLAAEPGSQYRRQKREGCESSLADYDERNDECLCSLDVNWDQVSFYAEREGLPEHFTPHPAFQGCPQ